MSSWRNGPAGLCSLRLTCAVALFRLPFRPLCNGWLGNTRRPTGHSCQATVPTTPTSSMPRSCSRPMPASPIQPATSSWMNACRGGGRRCRSRASPGPSARAVGAPRRPEAERASRRAPADLTACVLALAWASSAARRSRGCDPSPVPHAPGSPGVRPDWRPAGPARRGSDRVPSPRPGLQHRPRLRRQPCALRPRSGSTTTSTVAGRPPSRRCFGDDVRPVRPRCGGPAVRAGGR
jgi:hypothetical protein